MTINWRVGIRLLLDWVLNFHTVTEAPSNAEKDIAIQQGFQAKQKTGSLGLKKKIEFYANYIFNMDPIGQAF